MNDANRADGYRPLHAELGLPVAGFHDADRPSIVSDSINEMLVVQHEMHHDIALTETNFGFIQSIFRRVYDSPKSPTIRESVGNWHLHLLDHSRVAHEAYATYLSIKQQPYKVCASLVHELPQEYKDYYDKLACLIDEILPCTFLQFMVGKIVIEICFSSRLIEKMLAWQPGMPPRLEDVDSPDKRLEKLVPVWRSSLPEMRALLKGKCPLQYFYPAIGRSFDILSEKEWMALPLTIARRIDEWLEFECRDWMYPIASAVVPCSGRTEWFTQRNQFLEHMNTFTLGPAHLGGTEAEFLNEDDQKSAARRAFRAGRIAVSNPLAKLIQLKKIEASSFVNLVFRSKPGAGDQTEFTDKWDGITLISPEPSPTQSEGDWGVFQFNGEQCVAAYAVEQNTVTNLYRTLTRLALTGLPILGRLRIIVGLWATDAGFVDTSLMAQMVEACSVSSRRMELDNPVWYMGGNFLGFYKGLVAKGGLEGFLTNPFSLDPRLQELPLEKLHEFAVSTSFEEMAKRYTQVSRGPLWLIFRSPIIEGWFVRITSAGSGVLLPVIEDIIARKVRLLPRSEMESIWNLVSGIQEPILAKWSRF